LKHNNGAIESYKINSAYYDVLFDTSLKSFLSSNLALVDIFIKRNVIDLMF